MVNPFEGTEAGAITEAPPIEVPPIDVPVEGSDCVTGDGRAGTIVNGVCVATTIEVKEEPVVPDLELPAEAPPVEELPKVETRVETASAEQPVTPDWWNPEWTKMPQGTPFPIKYGEMPGNIPGTSLPYDIINHNQPNSAWLEDKNLIVQTDSPDQFNELMPYLQANWDVIERLNMGQQSRIEGMYKTAPQKLNLTDFVDRVENFKDWDTPTRQRYEWLNMQLRLSDKYAEDVAAYEQISDGETLTGLKGIPSAYQQRVKRGKGRFDIYDPEELRSEMYQAGKEYADEYNATHPDSLVHAEVHDVWHPRNPLVEVNGKLVPPESDYVPTVQFVTKDNWKVGALYESPDGTSYTPQQLISNTEALTSYAAQLPLDEVYEWVNGKDTPAEVKDERLRQTLRTLSKASQVEKRLVLEKLIPGRNPEVYNALSKQLTTPEQSAVDARSDIEEIKRIINEPVTDESREQLRKLLPGWSTVSYEGVLLPFGPVPKIPAGMDVPKFLKPFQAKGFRIPETGIERGLIAGIGGLEASAGGVASWLGNGGLSKQLLGEGKRLQALAMPETDNMVLNVANQIVQTVPFMVGMMPLALLGAMGGTTIGAATGLGAFGTLVLTSLGATILSRPFESLIEAGDAINTASDRGYDRGTQESVFNKVFWDNMKLAFSDVIQFVSAFLPMPQPIKSALSNSKITKVGFVGGKLIFNGLTEAGEEIYQNYIKKVAFGDSTELNEEDLMAGIVGGVMGLTIGGLGSVYSNVQDKTISKLPPEAQTQVNESIIEKAKEEYYKATPEENAFWEKFVADAELARKATPEQVRYEEVPREMVSTQEGAAPVTTPFISTQESAMPSETIRQRVAQIQQEALDELDSETLAQSVREAINEVKQETLAKEYEKSVNRVESMREAEKQKTVTKEVPVKEAKTPKSTEALPTEAQKTTEGAGGVVETGKVAEIDTKISAKLNSIKERFGEALESHSKTLGTPGAFTGEDLVLLKELTELAGLYVQKGGYTVESFAKALGTKVSAIVKEAWDKANETVGKESRLFSRVSKTYGFTDEALYTEINKEDVPRIAVEFVNKGSGVTGVVYGNNTPPKGTTTLAVKIAYAEKMIEEGNMTEAQRVFKGASLRATKEGQDIWSIQTMVSNDSPAHVLMRVFNGLAQDAGNKIKGIGTSKEKYITELDKGISKMKQEISGSKLSAQDLKSYIESLVC